MCGVNLTRELAEIIIKKKLWQTRGFRVLLQLLASLCYLSVCFVYVFLSICLLYLASFDGMSNSFTRPSDLGRSHRFNSVLEQSFKNHLREMTWVTGFGSWQAHAPIYTLELVRKILACFFFIQLNIILVVILLALLRRVITKHCTARVSLMTMMFLLFACDQFLRWLLLFLYNNYLLIFFVRFILLSYHSYMAARNEGW